MGFREHEIGNTRDLLRRAKLLLESDDEGVKKAIRANTAAGEQFARTAAARDEALNQREEQSMHVANLEATLRQMEEQREEEGS